MKNKEASIATNESGFAAKEHRQHFHSFDALRFFAFLKVFLLHLPVVAFPWFNYLRVGGGIGVQFFFVLSGFLITYIVLVEKQQTGQFDLKNFFARRVLRIWPLYYLMVLVAYSTPFLLAKLQLPSSAEGYEPDLWMSLLFLENYKMMMTHSHANVSPLSVMWSLCIEEHFYILWGVLLYACRPRLLPVIIAIAIAAAPVCRSVYVSHGIPTSDLFTNLDLFAFGAIPAFLWAIHRHTTESVVSAIPIAIKRSVVVLTIVSVFFASQLKEDGDFIWVTSGLGLLFSAVLILLLPAKSELKISDGNWLSRAGIYTYGMYLYHTLIINLLRQVFVRIGWGLDDAGTAVFFCIISFLLTLVCSVLSYLWFEQPFLRLKKYFR